MPITENINIETQVQSAITRVELQALVTASTVKKKIYHITDALGGTATIGVWSRSINQVSYNAFNLNTGKFGMYWLAFDVFNPIVEGDTAVMSYVNNTFFPATGNYNAVYLDLSTGIAYAWNGTTYFALSGGNVYAPTTAGFPATGATDTLYIATTTGVMYLWDGSGYVALNNSQYIPLTGTVTGNPVTGTIQSAVELFLAKVNNSLVYGVGNDLTIAGTRYSKNSHRTTSAGTAWNQMRLKSASYETVLQLYAGGPTERPQALVGSDDPNFEGIIYESDYSANFGDYSLIDLKTLKSRIWTKAGTPTTTDDSTQGYVVNSLIWDTTNSILYRCTSNSAGAATWTYAINTPTVIKSITDSAAVTGTTGATIIRSVLIPANTFTTGDIQRVRQRIRKTGTGGTFVNGIYVNTSASLTGASQLAIYTTTGTTQLTAQMKRDFFIKSATNTEGLWNNQSLPSDDIATVQAVSSTNIDWTVDQYLLFTVNPNSAADSFIQSGYVIEKL